MNNFRILQLFSLYQKEMYEGFFDPEYGSSLTSLGIKTIWFLFWFMLGNKLQMSNTQYSKHSTINIYQGGRLLLKMHFGY